ncbi:MAG: hypothetical protein ACOX69_00780 [Coriobacteriales bacterium]|jgi:hypothetical protein
MSRATRIAKTFASLSLASALVFTCAAGAASAAESDEDSESVSIGTLTDRYATLDDLANSLNTDDDVVISTRISTLSSVNRALEGSTVRFTGEVVDTAVNADDGHKWLSVADASDSSISVYVTDEQAAQIENYGSYQMTGDTVEVTGVYSVACGTHQGELDVHATDIKVTDRGEAVSHHVNKQRLIIGVVLCAVAAVLVVSFFYVRRIRRAKGKGK